MTILLMVKPGSLLVLKKELLNEWEVQEFMPSSSPWARPGPPTLVMVFACRTSKSLQSLQQTAILWGPFCPRIVSLSFWQTAPGVNDHIFPPLWKFSWALVENVMSFAMDSSVIHALCKQFVKRAFNSINCSFQEGLASGVCWPNANLLSFIKA